MRTLYILLIGCMFTLTSILQGYDGDYDFYYKKYEREVPSRGMNYPISAWHNAEEILKGFDCEKLAKIALAAYLLNDFNLFEESKRYTLDEKIIKRFYKKELKRLNSSFYFFTPHLVKKFRNNLFGFPPLFACLVEVEEAKAEAISQGIQEKVLKEYRETFYFFLKKVINDHFKENHIFYQNVESLTLRRPFKDAKELELAVRDFYSHNFFEALHLNICDIRNEDSRFKPFVVLACAEKEHKNECTLFARTLLNLIFSSLNRSLLRPSFGKTFFIF